MSLRKLAGLLAALGLVAGVLGSGLGAQFLDSVTGTENISVGTFSCRIITPSDGVIAVDQKSVTYTAPTIGSSLPGNAPFSFTVQNNGSIGQVLTVAMTGQSGNLGGHFSAMPATPSPVTVAAGGSQLVTTGIQWTALTNDDLGRSGSMTWTVSCGENNPTAIFDNTPAVLPDNLPSLGYQATQTSEFGAEVQFAGTARNLSTATVTMSSWACETGDWNVPFGTAGACVTTTPGATYSVPITFNVYANAADALAHGPTIATMTQTFAIPYRPSSISGGDGETWNGTSHGLANNITFTFAGELLPSTAVFGIAYNTDTWGYAPVGSTGPVDSLNVGVRDPASVGTFLPNDSSAYWNTHTAANYADGGVGGIDTFRIDSGGWAESMPAVQITATN